MLLLGSVAFADTDCNTSYTDNLKIRSLDMNSRPVEGAVVYVYHQYSGSIGSNGGTYHTTGPLITDASGIVNAKVSNIEQTAKLLDCEIKINASYGGAFRKITVIANSHPEHIDLKLDVYPVSIFVRDQKGAPIQGAKITMRNETRETDASGLAKFYSIAGKADYFASYLDAKASGLIDVTNDTVYGIVIPTYAITIRIIDDSGNPLGASITISNKTVFLPDGLYSQDKIFGDEIVFSTSYSGIVKNLKIYPAVDNSHTVVYDRTAPTIDIDNIKKEEIAGKVRLTISVSDSGLYPSGINTSSVAVAYREEGREDLGWASATTYISKKDIFVVDFPGFEPNSLVQFKIDVMDNEGNRATATGRFATSIPQAPTNNTNQQPSEEPQGGFPLPEAIIGVIIIVFVIYLFMRIKGMKEENQ